MIDKSVVGDLINFRGLVYSPMNENGVIFLFGKVAEDLNMYVEEIKPGFPDCIARRFTGKGWERISAEFEYRSSNFKNQHHDAKECDVIICWENTWPDCPIEVIELKDIIKSLPNKPVERPDARKGAGEDSLDNQLAAYPQKIRSLFEVLDKGIKSISDEIWYKVKASGGVTYYSPIRVFIDLYLQKQGLRLNLFTRGQKLDNVQSLENLAGGAKWGAIYLKDENDLEKVLIAAKTSFKLMNEAIKHNEPTGWGSSLAETIDAANREE
jgi:hypothetical protein